MISAELKLFQSAFFNDFINSNHLVVVDCWAEWCYPCKILGPIIDELENENKDVVFGKLNVDENNSAPIKYGIMSIPTLLYFKNGKLVDRSIGAMPKNAIQNKLEKIMA